MLPMIDRRDTLAGLLGAVAATSLPSAAFTKTARQSFGSGSNYRLSAASGCSDLLRVSTSIDVTEDIVCKATNQANGFNFQMNCYSNEARSAWQQYIVGLLGNSLHAKIDNFRSVGAGRPMKNIAQKTFPLLSLPKLTLPAGYQITISLLNDAGNNVTGVDFSIAKQGATVARKRVMLSELGLGTADMAPIVAFELVLVGPAGGHTAVLTSGAGTFAYAASAPLAAASALPTCVVHPNGTAEKANSVYGPLPPRPGAAFTQTFGTS
jgi:hypothetical protein